MGIQEHKKYVWVQADKAANNVVVVWLLHYFNTLKEELSGKKAYEEISEDEKSVVFRHCNNVALKFSVTWRNNKTSFLLVYWLAKRHKRTHKPRFANSSVCTITELLNY